MMLLLVAGAAALVAPGSRLPRAVACGGATYDYCVQALGCTAQEATKAERRIMPNIAEWITFARIEESCGWLQSSLDLSDAELKKMVLTFPQMLSLSVENNLAPTLDWLQTRLDTDDAELKKMVLTLPPLLSYSVGDKLAPKLEWLQKRLDLDAAQLRKVVGCPSVLSTRIDTLESKLEWLQTRLGLDAAQLKKVVLGTPLLSLSVEENLAPKLESLAREIGLSCAELRDWVVKNPTLLGYSLANRYRPRLEACRAAGVDEKRVLSYATQTDETFCKCIGIEPGALEAIRKQSVLSV